MGIAGRAITLIGGSALLALVAVVVIDKEPYYGRLIGKGAVALLWGLLTWKVAGWADAEIARRKQLDQQ